MHASATPRKSRVNVREEKADLHYQLKERTRISINWIPVQHSPMGVKPELRRGKKAE
jgi:hypothetical protein